jgi:hypothetical protein
MSVSAINSTAPAAILPAVKQSTAAPAASKPASTPNDTVTLSPAAQKASQAGDVDHDGDSH